METRVTKQGRWVGRFRAARVMSVLAVAGALLGSMARPAAAQDPNTPLRMDFFRLHCVDEQFDGLPDFSSEPYLVVFAADISGPGARAITVRSQIFQGVDSGDTRFSNPVMQVWNFNGGGSPILNPDKLIFLCALLEADGNGRWNAEDRANDVRNRVHSDLFPKLIAYHSAGLSRNTIVSNLKNDMNIAINASRRTDDRIGGVLELRLTWDDVLRARTGPVVQVTKTLIHAEPGADYRTTFVLQPTTIIIF